MAERKAGEGISDEELIHQIGEQTDSELLSVHSCGVRGGEPAVT